MIEVGTDPGARAIGSRRIPPAARPALDDEVDHSPPPTAVLDRMLASEGIDTDGFRLSLWSGFYTTPIFVEIERRHGLLRDENNILFCLRQYGPLTAKSVCDVLGRPKNSISRAAERLLGRRLIRREPVRSDRRRALMSIEPDGMALIADTTALFRERERDMLACLSPVERVALDAVLTKLMADAGRWLGTE